MINRMYAAPSPRQTFMPDVVMGWDKREKRVTRGKQHYAIRIIKSRLTRRKRGRGIALVNVNLRITLRITFLIISRHQETS